MKNLYFLVLVFINACAGQSQTDTTSLQKEASELLKNHTSTISDILSEKKYITLHPLTSFRQLSEQYCATGIITITSPDEPGRKINVMGSVVDNNGKAVAGAMVYLYQTDSRGWYAADAPHVLQNEGDMRHARLFGYIKTDANGKFELDTVKPSGYPKSDLPAHIHIHVTMSGYQSQVTELLFDDDDRLVGKIREQAIQNRFIIAKPEKTSAPFEQQFSYQLIINKN